MLLRSGQSPFEPRVVTVPYALLTGGESHRPIRWEAARGASPPGTMTESGQPPAIGESSSSDLRMRP